MAAVYSGCRAPEPPRLIAITLDDAPLMQRASYPGAYERAQAVDSLIHALSDRGIPATVFAIGQDLETAEDAALLARWAQAGIRVGNHSYSHTSFDELSAEAGESELIQTRARMETAVGSASIAPWFRFPYLEEGETQAKRAQWASLLDRHGLRSARVTVTTDDWRYDSEYSQAEQAQDWDTRYRIGQEYLGHVLDSVRFWDDLGRELYGRPVAHVFMVHANRINRDYLGPILDALEADGFQFVTLEEAYRDPLYQEAVTWTSTNGMSYLEFIKQDRLRRGDYP